MPHYNVFGCTDHHELHGYYYYKNNVFTVAKMFEIELTTGYGNHYSHFQFHSGTVHWIHPLLFGRDEVLHYFQVKRNKYSVRTWTLNLSTLHLFIVGMGRYLLWYIYLSTLRCVTSQLLYFAKVSPFLLMNLFSQVNWGEMLKTSRKKKFNCARDKTKGNGRYNSLIWFLDQNIDPFIPRSST